MAEAAEAAGRAQAAEKEEVVVKVGMVGDVQTGKTSLMVKFVEDVVQEDYIQTLGVNFMEKTVSIRNAHITFSIWDLGGQREFINVRCRCLCLFSRKIALMLAVLSTSVPDDGVALCPDATAGVQRCGVHAFCVRSITLGNPVLSPRLVQAGICRVPLYSLAVLRALHLPDSPREMMPILHAGTGVQ
jgi:hypothetical protein